MVNEKQRAECRYICKKLGKMQIDMTLADRYKYAIWAMYARIYPYITSGELASILGISNSEVTQKINNVRSDRKISDAVKRNSNVIEMEVKRWIKETSQ